MLPFQGPCDLCAFISSHRCQAQLSFTCVKILVAAPAFFKKYKAYFFLGRAQALFQVTYNIHSQFEKKESMLPNINFLTKLRTFGTPRFRVLGNSSTFTTPQFWLYLHHSNVPFSIHTSSVYAVATINFLLSSQGFFCVLPPQYKGPTLHTWVDVVAYFEWARKPMPPLINPKLITAVINNKSSNADSSSSDETLMKNDVDVDGATKRIKDDPDSPEVKKSTASIAFLQEEEAETTNRGGGRTSSKQKSTMSTDDSSPLRPPPHHNWMNLEPPTLALASSSSSSFHALEPDPVAQPRRRVAAMAIGLYSSWWLAYTASYFRWVYAVALHEAEERRRMLKGSSTSTTVDESDGDDTLLSSESPFFSRRKNMKEAPITEPVKAHARFFMLLDWGGSSKMGHLVRQKMCSTLSEYGIRHEVHSFFIQHFSDLCVQLDAHFRVYRFLLATAEPSIADVMLAGAFEYILKDDPPRSDILDGSMLHLERWIAEMMNDQSWYQNVTESSSSSPEEDNKNNAKHNSNSKRVRRVSEAATTMARDLEKLASSSPSSSSSSKFSKHPLPATASRTVQAVPLQQVTSADEDVVPETLLSVIALMEEVFPWLRAQRDVVEARINAFLEMEDAPMEVVTLADVPSLKEFANARVPAIGTLPRMLSRSWELEVDSPGSAAMLQQQVAKMEKAKSGKAAAAGGGGGGGGTGRASRSSKNRRSASSPTADAESSNNSSSSSSSSSSCNTNNDPLRHSTVISAGASMPHVFQAQYVARDVSKCDFSTAPRQPTTRIGGVVPMPDEKIAELKATLMDLGLEAPWDIAPQFEDRSDKEYVVFRRQVVVGDVPKS